MIKAALKWMAVPVVLMGGYIINGWVLSVLWGWFIWPLGVKAISIPEAIGISVVVQALWKPEYPIMMAKFAEIDLVGELVGKAFGETIWKPITLLFSGWLLTFFL